MFTGKHVPVELRQRRQWVAATITPDPKRPGKSIKRPVNPRTGGPASTTDGETWGTYEEAVQRAEKIQGPGTCGAIGFVFTAGDPYTGVDFDACYDEFGNLDPQVKRWVALLDSYTEQSLSGKGLHVIVKGQLPPGGCRKGQVEMYDRSRFFVMTGQRIHTCPAQINERRAELAQMHAEVFGAVARTGKAAGGEVMSERRDDLPAASPLPLGDDEILRLAIDAKNGGDFEALWLGRVAAYPSPSEADFSLACRLAFWTGGNLAQMDRIFRSSGLMRPKWDEKRNGKTYGALTLERALAQTKEFYRAPSRTSEAAGGEVLPERRDVPPAASPLPVDGNVPALPEGVLVDPALARGAAPWLDAFVAHVRTSLPWAYEEYAVAAGLHLLSTVAARRVLVNAGGKQYTNLYLLLVGPSSYAGKSRTARVATDLLDAAGLSFLRAPNQMTPQAYVKRANSAGSVDWKKRVNAEKWELEKLKAAFAGQSGWFYDEFGSFILQILNDNGPYQGFRPLLKEFDGCPPRYESETISRATEAVELPYLTLLAALTPGQFGKARRKFDELAEDGFWARFAFVACPPNWEKPAVRAPKDPPQFPPHLVRELVEWHRRLGIPQVEEVVPSEGDPLDGAGLPKAKGANGQPSTGELVVYRRPERTLKLADEVYEAYNCYREALEAAAREHGEEIAGNYSRHADRTLRIAALLASLQGDRLELRHWAYAQGIAERWRQGLHWALEAASASAVAPDVEVENRIVELVRRKGAMGANDIRKYLFNVSSNSLKLILDSMVKVGELAVVRNNRNGNPVYGFCEEV